MVRGVLTLAGLTVGSALVGGSLSSKEKAQLELKDAQNFLHKANEEASRMEKVTESLKVISELSSKAEIATTKLLPAARNAFSQFNQLVERKRRQLPNWRFVLEEYLGKWLGLTRVRLGEFSKGELLIAYRAIEVGEALRKIVDTPVLTWTDRINQRFGKL